MRAYLHSMVQRCATVAAVSLVLACVLFADEAPAALRIAAERLAGGFEEPLFVGAPPGDTSRIFVVQKTGQILIVNLPSGTVNPTPFLDIQDRV